MPPLSRNGPFDPLDVNAAVLDRLDRVSHLCNPACAGVGIGELARFDEFAVIDLLESWPLMPIYPPA